MHDSSYRHTVQSNLAFFMIRYRIRNFMDYHRVCFDFRVFEDKEVVILWMTQQISTASLTDEKKRNVEETNIFGAKYV